jgi:hypothetical protein
LIAIDNSQLILDALLSAEDGGTPCLGAMQLARRTGLPIHHLLDTVRALEAASLVQPYFKSSPTNIVMCLTADGRMLALRRESRDV